MSPTKGNGRNAGHVAPAETQQKAHTDFNGTDAHVGAFPSRHNTVTAEVLSRLLNGENLTGMDAVFCASTTRLAAVVEYIEKTHNWTIERCSIDIGTNDGREVKICVYFLPRTTIRRAIDIGARAFCSSVKDARAKRRKNSSKAKASASTRNATRPLTKFNPNQGSLFSGGDHE